MRCLTLIPGLALVAGGAVLHGAVTHRWGDPHPDAGRVDAVHAVAVALPNYRSEAAPADTDPFEQTVVTCRRYTSADGRVSAAVAVTTGPVGAVATHTPDVCYVASGFKLLAPPEKEAVPLPGGGSAEVYAAVFEKPSATGPTRVRVRWAWAAAGRGVWEAPDRPRFAYLRAGGLVKVAVVTPAGDGREPAAVREFVAAALAEYARPLGTAEAHAKPQSRQENQGIH